MTSNWSWLSGCSDNVPQKIIGFFRDCPVFCEVIHLSGCRNPRTNLNRFIHRLLEHLERFHFFRDFHWRDLHSLQNSRSTIVIVDVRIPVTSSSHSDVIRCEASDHWIWQRGSTSVDGATLQVCAVYGHHRPPPVLTDWFKITWCTWWWKFRAWSNELQSGALNPWRQMQRNQFEIKNEQILKNASKSKNYNGTHFQLWEDNRQVVMRFELPQRHLLTWSRQWHC